MLLTPIVGCLDYIQNIAVFGILISQRIKKEFYTCFKVIYMMPSYRKIQMFLKQAHVETLLLCGMLWCGKLKKYWLLRK